MFIYSKKMLKKLTIILCIPFLAVGSLALISHFKKTECANTQPEQPTQHHSQNNDNALGGELSIDHGINLITSNNNTSPQLNYGAFNDNNDSIDISFSDRETDEVRGFLETAIQEINDLRPRLEALRQAALEAALRRIDASATVEARRSAIHAIYQINEDIFQASMATDQAIRKAERALETAHRTGATISTIIADFATARQAHNELWEIVHSIRNAATSPIMTTERINQAIQRCRESCNEITQPHVESSVDSHSESFTSYDSSFENSVDFSNTLSSSSYDSSFENFNDSSTVSLLYSYDASSSNVSTKFPEELYKVFGIQNATKVLSSSYITNPIFHYGYEYHTLNNQNKLLMQQLFTWHLAKHKNLIPTNQFYKVNVEPPFEWRKLDVSNYSDDDLKRDVKELWPNPTKVDLYIYGFNEMTLYQYLFEFQDGKYNDLNTELKNNLKRIVLKVKNAKKTLSNHPNQQVSDLLSTLDNVMTNHEGHCEARLIAIINEMSKGLDQIETLLSPEKHHVYNVEEAIVTEFKKIAFGNTALEVGQKKPDESVMVMNTLKNFYKDIFNLNYYCSGYIPYYGEKEVKIRDILDAFSNNLSYNNLSTAANNIISLQTDENKIKLYDEILKVKLTFTDYCKLFNIKKNTIKSHNIKKFADKCIDGLDHDEDYEYWRSVLTSLKDWTGKNNTMSLEDVRYIAETFIKESNDYNIKNIFDIFDLNGYQQKTFASDHPQILYLYLTDKGFFKNLGSASL